MGKAFSHYHMNPYRITPAVLENDPWAYPVLTWKDLPMMYGPAWTLLIAGIARVAITLRTALFVAKLFFLAIVVVSGWIYWKLLTVLEPTSARRLQKLALLAWNPFVIQTTLVDMHNDALLMLAISASVWLLLKKRFALSSLLLFVGGLIKYAPSILIPVPLFYLIKQGRAHLGKTAQILALLAASAVGLLLLLYLPFGGFSPETYSGIQKQLSHIGLATEYLPGTALILQIFPMSLGALYGWGLLLGAGAEIVCLRDNRLLQAFTFPFLLIFFFRIALVSALVHAVDFADPGAPSVTDCTNNDLDFSGAHPRTVFSLTYCVCFHHSGVCGLFFSRRISWQCDSPQPPSVKLSSEMRNTS